MELTGGKLQPVKAFWKLREIEFWASKAAENYCDIPNYDIDTQTDKAEKEVQKIFNGKLKGFFVNRDPRGYALKIDNDTAPAEYKELGLHTDMGGYYILAP